MSDIHSRIKDLRLSRRLSMEALGARVGVSWQTVQQWEKSDGTAPKRTRLDRVAAELGTTVEYLTSGRQPTLHVNEPPAVNYTANVRVFPPQNDPLIIELITAAEKLSERGLVALIERATALADKYPAESKRPLSQ